LRKSPKKPAYAGSMHMDEPPQNPRATVLLAFREALVSGLPPGDSMLPELGDHGLLEQALHELKRSRPRMSNDDPWRAFRLRLEEASSRARERRMHRWQLDPGRRTVRMCMDIAGPACGLHPPALQAALAQAMMAAGVQVALGLEKSPRPLVRLGHPLPPGIEGRAEWADAVLQEAPVMTCEKLAVLINEHCPEGLRILRMEGIPNHASPVLELCLKAHWAWACPGELKALAEVRLARFEEAATFGITKLGKVEGHKQEKRVEVRHLVLQMRWEEDGLHFTTRLSAGEALNPVKLLAGVLEVETAAIQGLTRLSVELAEDPRLAQAERYEPKLHNIFEDAVLLDSGSNIRLIEDDEDEPILLRQAPRNT